MARIIAISRARGSFAAGSYNVLKNGKVKNIASDKTRKKFFTCDENEKGKYLGDVRC
jgi:hypothetical protein